MDDINLWQDFLSFYRAYVLPYGLGIIMLGMGLTLTPADFYRILSSPRAGIMGVSCQMILLPLIAFGLSVALPLSAMVAFSLILVSACPGGISSNAIVFAIRGDVALSVTLTAISSTLALFTVPFIANLGLALHYGSGTSISLPVLPTIYSLFVVTILPISTGMLARRFLPGIADHLSAFLRRTSTWILAFIVIIGTIAAIDFSVGDILSMYIACQSLALCGIILGVFLAIIGGLPRPQRVTIAIEIGMQNVALAMLVANNILLRPEFAIVPGIYGAIMFLTVIPAIFILKKRTNKGVLSAT